MDLLPKVFRTEGNIAEFDPTKIFESILKETGLSETEAKHITELTVRRIISSGIKFLSGPHIREIVCSILSEQHFEDERKLYTRIGMPLMDYEEILEKQPSNILKHIINPEKIHHWAANKIAEEYAHLRILNNEESKAHLYGDIHINGLNYFDLRPFSQKWDPRLFLKFGFPPINNVTGYFKLKPAKDFNSALYQLAKWLGLIQNEFYGPQAYSFITIFLAPFVKKYPESKIIQEIRKFIYDINQLPNLIGREISETSIFSSFSILNQFSNVMAIGPNGKNTNVYEDYYEECMKIFKGFIQVFKEGYNNTEITTPIHYLIINNQILEEFDKMYSNFWFDIEKTKFSYFLNYCSENRNKIIKANFGILQDITLNLPRYAYSSKNEDSFIEFLNSKLNLCEQILLKKHNIIKKRIASKHLPLCSGTIKNELMYNLKNQYLSISLVGLNEAVKYFSNYELHEHSEAVKLGRKILKILNEICAKFTERNNKKFILSENTSEIAIRRFSKLDSKHFPQKGKLIYNTKNHNYTNSIHFRDNKEISLIKRLEIQGEFHQLIQSGAIEYISLDELKISNETIKDFIKKICKGSISCIKLYS